MGWLDVGRGWHLANASLSALLVPFCLPARQTQRCYHLRVSQKQCLVSQHLIFLKLLASTFNNLDVFDRIYFGLISLKTGCSSKTRGLSSYLDQDALGLGKRPLGKISVINGALVSFTELTLWG